MELLRRFASGDLDAFEALFRQFQAEVYGWIVQIVWDRWVAEDLTMETFWRIYRARARFDPTRSFGAWARRIGTNVALSHLAHTRPEVALPENFPEVRAPDPVLQRETRAQIVRAFAQLPPQLRLVATLALVEETPYQEIAEALGISVGTVKLRVFRAVRRLRKSLKRVGVEP